MRLFKSASNRQNQTPVSRVSLEVLENRRFLSASPVAALTVNAVAGSKFHGAAGTWATTTPLPKASSGYIAIATINWGDGKTSHAKLVQESNGTVEIDGSHTWTSPGTFQTVVNVEEIPKRHGLQLTEIGQADGQAVVAPRPSLHTLLKGTVTGSYTAPFGNPDAGKSYDFTGAGIARAMGTVTVSGSITTPGLILSGKAQGTLTLTTTSMSSAASGSLTLAVSGHSQNGGGPLPEKLSYVITGGTGAFAHDGGKGTISLALDTMANTFVLVIH